MRAVCVTTLGGLISVIMFTLILMFFIRCSSFRTHLTLMSWLWLHLPFADIERLWQLRSVVSVPPQETLSNTISPTPCPKYEPYIDRPSVKRLHYALWSTMCTVVYTADRHTSSLYPSCLQTTQTLTGLQFSSQTVTQLELTQTSSLPSCNVVPLTSWTSPSGPHWIAIDTEKMLGKARV